MILTTPFLRALRRRFPDARIDFAIRREYADLLRHHPALSRLHEIDVAEGREGLLRWKKRFAGEKYDRVFDLHNNFRTKFLRAGLKAPLRTINKRIFQRWLLVNMKWNLFRGIVPVAERYIETGAELGLVPDGEGAEMFIPDQLIQSVGDRIGRPGKGPLIALCPGAGHATKRWPVEYFAAMGKALAGKYGARFLILGGNEDHLFGETIAAALGGGARNLCGALPILESAAAMDRCDLVVSNDTGLMHIAAARRRPLIALFGSTVEEFGFYPYKANARVACVSGLSCRPCSHLGYPSCPKIHFRCMKDITPGQAVRLAEELLSL